VAEVYGTPRRPRRRWGRRLSITLIVLLIILGVILVVADRIGVSYAERMIGDKVAEQVASQKATSDQPEVTIEGFPFLTQVAAGKYHEVKIELANFSAPTNGQTLKLPLLDVRGQDVRAPLSAIRSGGSIVATTVTGTGTIDYAQLAKLIGQPGLKLTEKDGKLTGSLPVQLLGQTFTVSGTAALTVKNGTLQVNVSDVQTGDAPDAAVVRNLINTYVKSLGVSFKLPTLPLRLAVEKLQPEPNGLTFTAGAHNVAFNSGGL
jgi:hypothetical protein